MSEEKIFCFGGQECTYSGDTCPAYHGEWDTCLMMDIFKSLKSLFMQGAIPEKAAKPEKREPVKPIDLKGIPAGAQQVVTAILELKPDLTIEAITELAETEKAKAAGLLTMEAAYYLVATNLGAEEREEKKKPRRKPAKKTSSKKKGPANFSEFEEGGYAPVVKGTLLEDPVTRDIDTSRGPTTITNFRITDGHAELRVGLWGELGADYDGVKGDKIHLTGMGIKDVYDDVLQIASTKNTEIK